jgi:hypothetical protein
VRYVGNVVHFGASEVPNVDTLFFMLGWHKYGFNKKCARACYTKLVSLHLVSSAGDVVHSGASASQNIDALLFMLEWA